MAAMSWVNPNCTTATFALGCHATGDPASWAGGAQSCTQCHTDTTTPAVNPTSGLHNVTTPTIDDHDSTLTGGSGTGCEKCHDAKHSPRFDFARAKPRVLHTRAAELGKLPRAEREKELKRLCSGAQRELFDPNAAYVGSAACKECHPTAYEALRDRPHTGTTARLAKPAWNHWRVPRYKRGVVGIRKAKCLRCHVTGYGRPGGFPADVPDGPASHAMAGVGCEACHGPGKAHADDPKELRAIARLGGTCNECNVLPICRQCHDDTNSPEFDYRTALPKARHPAGDASQGYR